MFARAPHLIETTLLSAINVGGDADTTGAMLGALLGALHGWKTFPDEWRDGLEARDDLKAQAEALCQKLLKDEGE
jgi:ADP-ribosylglycohydrolase